MSTAPRTPLYRLPTPALVVLDALEAAGFEAWVVGGWVRDALRGAPSHDVDVTTDARWQQVATCLRSRGVEVHETGTRHGTVTAVVEGAPVEVTTYRTEGGYSDHRHPDEVTFVRDVRRDLERRDFTINAMAFHPRRGLLDLFGGADDLARGVIRAVGEPRRRFEEDALRVLRALRFAARLGFAIEPATQCALDGCAGGLADIAQERIGQELDGIVTSGRLAWALLEQTGPLCRALPELRACVGFDQRSPYHAYTVLEHTARVCRSVEAFSGGMATRELRWAALLHDVAKPLTFTVDASGRGHFFGHPKRGAQMTEHLLRRYALPGDLVEGVRTLVRLHDHGVAPSAKAVRRLLLHLDRHCPGRAPELVFSLLTLMRSDAASKVASAASYAVELDQTAAVVRRELARGSSYRVADLAVSGADVMDALGTGPGPQVGEALTGLLERVVADEVANNREALLSLLVRRR
ncbi:CCA tRNA nucleotidyltransferase [Olsenella sp. HMSC062G07]|uniref:CCA tRNA nucleotidyltransferase n=1 Tax=Olsenella sp. HMSC062G07 TaxID=1739330 RepID=UPI0008A10544|nr:HD domain-containing protein [Olsenella sp. HMSC062G07]OFK24885.1 phosphohydrolase [Olsenella sp. HMSC062G07]